jgi:hypothetical protein
MATANSEPTYKVLDICAGLHGFSQAFHDSPQWDVTTIDITDTFETTVTLDLDPWGFEQLEFATTRRIPQDYLTDVRTLRSFDFAEDFDLIIASPPCTTYSLAAVSTHRHEDGTPKRPKGYGHDQLIRHIYNLIQSLNPDFWFIENPTATLRNLPPLYDPEGTITLCQFGEMRQKRTDLWGEHPPTFDYPQCSRGDDCHEAAPRGSKTGTQGINNSADRAKLPYELSEYVKKEVTNALDTGLKPKTQTSLSQLPGTESDTGTTVDYCEYCGEQPSPGQEYCCGHPLTADGARNITSCSDGHYHDAALGACPWCEYPEANDAFHWKEPVCSCPTGTKTVDSHDHVSYPVPDCYHLITTHTDHRTIVQKEDEVLQEYEEKVYRCEECGHAATPYTIITAETVPSSSLPQGDYAPDLHPCDRGKFVRRTYEQRQLESIVSEADCAEPDSNPTVSSDASTQKATIGEFT